MDPICFRELPKLDIGMLLPNSNSNHEDDDIFSTEYLPWLLSTGTLGGGSYPQNSLPFGCFQK